MEVQLGPNSIDEPNLLYKFQRKIKVFNTNNSLPKRGYNLVASCSKYGIVFIVAPNGALSAYYLKDLIDKECVAQHVTLNLQIEPTHIAVNCDQEWLAVIGNTMLFVYKILDFQNQNTSPSFSIKLDVNPSTFVSAFQWNPCIPEFIAIAFYDGTLIVSQINTMQVKKLQSNVRCICWSPKGKQLVTGNNDGSLCQYKPDLSPMKTVPPPILFEGSLVEALAIYWISTYQFAVVYKNANNNSRPAVTIVNTPKASKPSCYNYEDICYSMGSNRPWYYYLYGLAQWNIILASSSNSTEVATLGSTDGVNWLQWCQTDEARPELPLVDKKQEDYPVGLCIDTCGIHQLPWGENETLRPMPLLLVLSHTGLLTIYNVVNLKNEAPPLCTQPQQLTLPAHIMTSIIPDDVPQADPVVTPAPISQPAPQPVQPSPVQPSPVQPSPAQPSNAIQAQPTPAPLNQISITQPLSMQKSQVTQGFFSASTTQIPESQPIVVKPQIAVVQNTAYMAPSHPVTSVEVPAPTTKTPIQTQEINAALKCEQERVNKMKANEELKNMLIKEVNDFQMELYKYMIKTRETRLKVQRDIEFISSDFTIQSQNIDQIRNECSLEEFRESIVRLKLELVRACAVVAEARTHAETKHLSEWSQADPLTAKRVASVKKLAYYVQNQLDQAHKALDHKWNEMAARNVSEKPGHRMIRPILDDIYQPLVKQQEILSRQQAVLRTLRNTLKECGDISPVFKTTSILRSTPFRNKADPLSKLTKNILNMSIEPEKEKGKEQMTNHKLDALKDMLSNHKTVKIKPVNVELRQQLAAMRLNYEKDMKEKEAKEKEIKVQAARKIESENAKIKPSVISALKPDIVKSEPKVENKSAPVITVPTYTPVSNVKVVKPALANIARTLFVDEPKSEEFRPNQQQQAPPIQAIIIKSEQQKVSSGTVTVTDTTRNLLKGMLHNKSQANIETRNDENTFMGQIICTPTNFNVSKTPTTIAAPSPVFTSKPIADIHNMFSKLQPQPFSADPKPQLFNVNVKSDETGEPESTEPKEILDEKPLTNVFILKQSVPLGTTQSPNVPDVLKSSSRIMTKVDANNKADVKVKEKGITKLKENIPDKESEKLTRDPQNVTADKKPSPSFVSTAQPVVLSTEIKEMEAKPEMMPSKSDLSQKSTSIFNSTHVGVTVPKSEPVFEASTSQAEVAVTLLQSTISTPSTPNESTTVNKTEVVTTASASSIFGAAVAASQKSSTSIIKPSSPIGSIFATSSPSNVFGSSSIFGTSVPTTGTSPSKAQSIFSAAVSATPFTPTPSPVTSTETEKKVQPSDESSVTLTPTSITSTTASIFAPQSTSVFKTTADPPITTQSNFAASTSETVFATPITQSVFNTAIPTPVFGSALTTTQSVFSTPATTSSFWNSSTQNWAFPSNQQSTFGSVASTQSSIFGTPTPSTQASVFGAPTQTTQSVFGSATTTQASVFGTPTTTQSSSLFGGAEANLFAAASISTTNAPSPTSGGNIFGGSSSSAFSGGNTNIFGGKTAFGQSNQSAASIFGEANSTFKQNTSTNFWSGGSAASGNAFGSSGFGQQATTQASIFGGTTGGSFSAPSTGQPLGSPQAGAFGGEAKPSVFGTPQQQTPPAFGGSTVFGSKSSFGQTASFGSPTGFGGFNKSPSGGFGAPATFGGAAFGSPGFGGTSPGKVFGGASPTPGFGAPTQSNSTFESLATQNTLTFGNLAQQSPQQNQPQPTFNTSPSFTGWRG